MPEKKTTPATVLTGTTDRPAVDMAPRTAASLIIGFGVGAGLKALGVDPLAIGGLASATAVLVLSGFDTFLKDRIKRL